MSKKTEITITPKQLATALATEQGQKAVLDCMDKLFESGRWEIPDEAIVGIYAAKVDQLEAQNKSLLELVKQLSAEVRDKMKST